MLLFRLLVLLSSNILIANSVTVGDDCKCPTEEFDEFTNRGSLKLFEISDSCKDVVHCEWIIAPNENKSLTLFADMMEFSRYDSMQIVLFNQTHNSTFDYRTTEHKKQFIGTLNSDSAFFSKTTEVPIGFGVKLFLRRNISDVREFAGYTFEDSIQILFFRHSPENRTCPPPILEASETKQIISLPDDNSSPSCFFVIKNNLGDDYVLLMEGALNHDFKLRYSLNDGSIRNYDNHYLLWSSNKVGFLLTKESTSIGMVNSTYLTYRVIKNPCKCEKETLTVEHHLNLISPGFGYTCGRLDCETKIVASNASDDVSLIVSIHKMQVSQFNHIYFDNYYESHSEKDLNVHFSPNDTNRNWNSWSPNLTISYNGHGADAEYNITVTRVQLPPECVICGEGAKITSAASGFVHLAVPAHCRFITCKWTVNPELSTIFNWNKSPMEAWEVDVEYMFSDSEYVVIRKRDNKNSSLDVFDQSESNNRNSSEKHSFSSRLRSKRPFTISYYRWNSTANDSELTVSWKHVGHTACNISSSLASPTTWNELQSPNYPEKYYNNIDCNYTLTAPDGYHILLNITDFETEGANDILSIYDGATIEKRNLIARRSNVIRNDAAKIIRSTQSAMVLHFLTDLTDVRKGFQILFTAEKSEEIEGSDDTRKSNDIKESDDVKKSEAFREASMTSSAPSPNALITTEESSSNSTNLADN